MRNILLVSFFSLFWAYAYANGNNLDAIKDCTHTLNVEVKENKSDYFACNHGYAIAYDYQAKIPTWVAYKVTRRSIDTNATERKNSFYVDRRIPKEHRSNSKDYSKSGYDRGHMAPSGSIDYSIQANKETFFYSNIAPQVKEFNRAMHQYEGAWGELENIVRRWSRRYDELYIIAGTHYGENSKTIGSGVVVPDYFWKVVYDAERSHAIAFLMPQDKNTMRKMNSYLVSIDDIERLTGIDMFHEMDESVQKHIEAVKYRNWKGF